MNTNQILELKNLSVHFGGVKAVNNFTLNLAKGEFIGLIGPNGAGKTTVFNLISGSIQPTHGSIIFKNQPILKKRPDELCHLGISRTFQNIRLFPQMTVFENIALGIHSKPHYTLLEAFIRTPAALRAEKQLEQKVKDLLELVSLSDFKNERAGNLPYGLQRRLEMARAMATDPELLLLDEPAAGMNDEECTSLIRLIRQIYQEKGYSIILIEHHMNVIMDLCANSIIYVLNLGELLASGSPKEIQENPDVIRAYLGERKNGRNH